jgi:hypothetical protein
MDCEAQKAKCSFVFLRASRALVPARKKPKKKEYKNPLPDWIKMKRAAVAGRP